MRLTALVLTLALVALPGCGLQSLIIPLIERGLDEIFKDDQKGDLVPDDTDIGAAVDLEIAMGGRFCCDPANGVNQQVTTVTVRHTGDSDSFPITYEVLAGTESKLTATPRTGTLARGEVATIDVFADDCDFFVEELSVRTYFDGANGSELGVPGRSTTTVLTVRNVCDDEEPAVDAFLKLFPGSGVQAQLATNIRLVEYGEAVKHGNDLVPDRIPDIPLSQIGLYGSLEVILDATAIEDAFTGGSAAFPVGTHSNGSVYAADIPATMTPGAYRMIFFGLDGSFDLIDISRTWRFAVAADSDGESGNNLVPGIGFSADPFRGTDRWYILDFVPGSGWNVRLIDSSGAELASAVRVLQVANALLFVIPKSELPGPGAGYRAISFTHTGDNGTGVEHDWSGDHHPTPDLASLPN